MFSFSRIFKDNSHYNEVFGLYGDAFVEAIGWFFSDKDYNGEENKYYCLNGKISTVDFMCCVWHFICVAGKAHPMLTLKDEINRFKSNVYCGREYYSFYNYDDDDIVFKKVDFYFFRIVLWCAYIYWKIKLEKDPKNKELKTIVECLYELFYKEVEKDIEVFDYSFLIDQIEPTMNKFHEIAPTDEEIAEMQKNKDIDKKTLDDYLNDPVYGQCYEGILSVLGVIGMNDGKEYDEEDYLNVYKQAEKLVQEVLQSKRPEIPIRNIQARLHKDYPDMVSKGKGFNVTFVTIDRVYGRLIEEVFIIAVFDKLENKSNFVTNALEDFRDVYENYDSSMTYRTDVLWKLVLERIPHKSAQPSMTDSKASAEKQNEELNELKKEYEELKSKYEEAREEIEAYKQEPLESYSKVRLEVFYSLLKKSGANSKISAYKTKCAKIAEYVTGYKFRTCLNYMSKRDASVHEKEMIELRTKLENIGIKW